MESEHHKQAANDPQTAPDQAKVKIDPVRLQALMQKLRDEQNLTGGLLAGIGAAVVGAAIWAAITFATHFQIGWMAIGVGFLVGIAVRKYGHGIDMSFGIMGAILALLGCLAGNLFATCASIAGHFEIGYWEVISQLNFDAVTNIMVETFHPMDVLFYGIALYAGYKHSFHTLTQSDVQSLLRSA